MRNPTGSAVLPPVSDDTVVVPWLDLVRRGLVPAVPIAGPGEIVAAVADFCRANKVTARQADNLGPGLAPSDVARLELARRQAAIADADEKVAWAVVRRHLSPHPQRRRPRRRRTGPGRQRGGGPLHPQCLRDGYPPGRGERPGSRPGRHRAATRP